MHQIRDGDLYRRITVAGKTFELRYGYYEEYERTRGEPVPIYPDFSLHPQYGADGAPFVTAMQDACPHYAGVDRSLGCFGCQYFREREDLIGICRCPARQLASQSAQYENNS